MALGTPTALTGDSSTTDATDYDTASITPTANALVLVTVMSRNDAGSEPTTPTLSGCNITWVKINESYYFPSGSNRRKVTMFRGLSDSPTSGAITISHGADTMDGCLWQVSEITGVSTDGTSGSGAIVQAPTPTTGLGTDSLLSMATLANSTNLVFGTTVNNNAAITPNTDWNEIAEHSNSTLGIRAQIQYKANDTEFGGTFASSNWGCIAIEVTSGAGGTGGGGAYYSDEMKNDNVNNWV